MARNQFKRLEKFKKQRNNNRNKIINKITKSSYWNNQFKFLQIPKNINPSWMGLPIILSERFRKRKNLLNIFIIKELRVDQ